jgi:phosphoribulokinase
LISPLLRGIVGDSAAGKSTIAKGLTQLLGRERITHVGTDHDHNYDSEESKRLDITPLHPDRNYLDILALHLE